MDFGRLRKVTQVVTQGRYDYGQWVTSFYLTSSMDNVHWSMYRFKSANKVKAVKSYHVVYRVTRCVIPRGVSCYVMHCVFREWFVGLLACTPSFTNSDVVFHG